jgi:hypothetical protein
MYQHRIEIFFKPGDVMDAGKEIVRIRHEKNRGEIDIQ